MRIDVIIVNYNAGRHLTKCVISVLNSTIPVNVFISDNGSTDSSIELLQQSVGQAPNLFIQKNHKNLGFSRGNNAVYANSTADYILFLNPDCIIKPDTLEKLITEFDRHPQVGMIGCKICNMDGTEQLGCRRNIPTPWRTLIHMLRLERFFKIQNFLLTYQPLPKEPTDVEAISGAFMLTRKSAISEVGLLDEDYFLHCEDLDWFMRFKLKNWRILFVPQIAITHVKGVCSQRTPFKVLWHKHKGMMRFYRKFFRDRYSIVFLGIVSFGIWLRFFVLVVHQLIQWCHRQGRSRMHQFADNVTDTHIS